MKECIICKKMFEESNKDKKCCSNECTVIKNKNNQKAYQQTINFKNSVKKYTNSIKGKTTLHNYQQLDSYKTIKKEYKKSINGKIVAKRYRISAKGKLNHKIQNHRRRERKNNCIHAWTKEEWINKLNQTNGICQKYNGLCLSENPNVGIDTLEGDHIYPIAQANIDFLKTGIKRKYTINDIQFLCKPCNSSKKDKCI